MWVATEDLEMKFGRIIEIYREGNATAFLIEFEDGERDVYAPADVILW